MKRFNIECGASKTSTPDAIAMDVQGPAQNVNLRIDYISRSMLGNVPDIWDWPDEECPSSFSE